MTVPSVTLHGLPHQQGAAWDVLLDMAPHLGTGWTLIGGQMVALHQAERQPPGMPALLRMSSDIDVVINIRADNNQAAQADDALRKHGFVQLAIDVEHRYVRDSDGVVCDVLAPDHLGRNLPRLGRGHTLGATGGTQALQRTSWVTVTHGSRRARIARPSLVGALLIKIAASTAPSNRGSDRHIQDVMSLAALLQERDLNTAALSKSERKRIQRVVKTIAGSGSEHAQRTAERLTRIIDKGPAAHNG